MVAAVSYDTERISERRSVPSEIILVEGPSGAGKSTLIKGLCAQIPEVSLRAYKACPWDQDPKEFYDLGAYEPPLILDRWLLSNIVYGTLMANQPCLGSYDIAQMRKPLKLRTIVLLAHPGVLAERNRGRGRGEFDAHANLVVTAFRQTTSSWNPTFIDTTLLTPDQVLERAL